MRFRFPAAWLALSVAAAGQTTTTADQSGAPSPPDTVQQRTILAEAAEYAMNHEKSLPDFICTQTTQRFMDYTGKGVWRPVDLIVERLTYFEHHEEYKIFLVNGQPSSATHNALGGTTSSGEFGSVMKGIFFPDTDAHFTWERFFTLRGRRTHVYSYRVEVARSDYHIVVPLKKLDLVTAYHGLVFIDDRKHSVYRITLHADGIPADFPVQEVSLALDYDYTRIGDSDYLLPLEYELRSREGARLIKNDVKYEGYRKFSAETNITFDAPATPPAKPEKQHEE